MATKRKEINGDSLRFTESEQTGIWSESSCQVEEEEVIFTPLLSRCEYRQDDQSNTACRSFGGQMGLN